MNCLGCGTNHDIIICHECGADIDLESDRALLEEAVSLLRNHDQHEDEGWKEDYENFLVIAKEWGKE